MSALLNHLDQIDLITNSLTAQTFPSTGPFTNALLNNHEITRLIRDTEPYERGLFRLDPDVSRSRSQSHRVTLANSSRNGSKPSGSAVARVLGKDMLRAINRSERARMSGKGLDIEVLLQSAEKLSTAYEAAGTAQRILDIRARNERVLNEIESYETRLREQTMTQRFGGNGATSNENPSTRFSEEDVLAEMDVVGELEARKLALEERVNGIQRDLSGLMK